MDWNDVSFVLSGSKRKGLLLALDNPRTPAQLSKIISVSVTNMWSKLKALEDKGLVECITPEAKKGRIYRLTKKGESVLKEVKKTN